MPVLLVVKLVVHPLIVYLLLSWIGGFDRIWVYAAVLMAALPPAANVLALAQKYESYRDQSVTGDPARHRRLGRHGDGRA